MDHWHPVRVKSRRQEAASPSRDALGSFAGATPGQLAHWVETFGKRHTAAVDGIRTPFGKMSWQPRMGKLAEWDLLRPKSSVLRQTQQKHLNGQRREPI